MMESVGRFCKGCTNTTAIDLVAARLGIKIDIIEREPLRVRITNDDGDPVRAVVKGMVWQRVCLMHGKTMTIKDEDGILSF